MGGIAFHVPENLPESKKFLPSDASETWFLEGEFAYSEMLEDDSLRDSLPNLSKEEIKSKSKANGLAKAFVCVQALWFIAQCFSRCMLSAFHEKPLLTSSASRTTPSY